jgi:thymidine phosphorylase
MTMYLIEDLIRKKRDGLPLNGPEISAFVEEVSAQTVSDAQIAAFCMAVWFQGMNLPETLALTTSMRDSGEVLQWDRLEAPVLDKHSTGGVGDLVSLVLGPVIAACGAHVPMISGRGLGHTGGTVDKLESIPGFDARPAVDKFQRLVQVNGVAIIGQTQALAPADRRFYAVRDVTATVASIPLIVASILSKKLAEGLDGLVMDVKLGSGAFMREASRAQQLAQEISRVSCEAGLPCTALITDMNLPLASSAGNALEVSEAIDFLAGKSRHDRLHEVILTLGAEMLLLGGLAEQLQQGKDAIISVLDSGQAAERFERMVAAQGGPADLLEHPERYLPAAAVQRPVFPETPGFVTHVDTLGVGMAVVGLGGGRYHVSDTIDPAVGLSELCTAGQWLDEDTPIATIHAASEDAWLQARDSLLAAFQIDEQAADIPSVIYQRTPGAQAK